MAASDTVKLYISGNLLEGADRAQAIIKLADMLKISPAKVAKLIDGKPHLIRRELPADQVDKYRAALAKAGFETLVRAETGDEPSTSAPNDDTGAAAAVEPTVGSLTLLETGAPVLADNERPQKPVADIATDHLAIAADDAPLSEHTPTAAAIDAPDIDIAEFGADIESIPKPPPPPPPDTDQLSAAPPGVELERLKKPAPPPPDVSHLSVAD